MGPKTPTMQNILSKGPLLAESLPQDAAPILIWSIDREGIFQMIEGDMSISTDQPRDELIGQSIFKVFEDYPAVLNSIRSALAGEQDRAVIEAGAQLWECRFYPLREKGKVPHGVIGVAYDLSFQQELWHQEALTDAAAALRKARTFEEMPPLIVGNLRQLLAVDQAALVLGSPPEQPFELNFSWGGIGQDAETDQGLMKILTDPRVVKNLIGSSRMTEEKYPDELRSAGLYGFPLIVHEELMGALWVGRQKPFRDQEMRLIRGIADMSASAFQRAKEHELTQRRLARLAALHSIDQAISGSFNLDLTLHIISGTGGIPAGCGRRRYIPG